MAPAVFEAEAAQRALRLARLLQQLRASAYQKATDITGLDIGSLSKRKLSQLLGVSATLINKYENAEIDPWDIRWSLIRQLSQLSSLSLDELDQELTGEENLNPDSSPTALLAELRLQVQQLEQVIDNHEGLTALPPAPTVTVPWFGRYLRTLIADEARESGKDQQSLRRKLIAAFPSPNSTLTDRFQAVLEGESELTAAEIETMASAIASALSVVIEAPITAGQLRALLP